MATNLYQASNQWAQRPADERFASLKEMHEACRHWHDSACQATINMGQVEVHPDETSSQIQIAGPAGTPATLTHWSFKQLAQRVKAPANYLATLPADVASQAINHGLRRRGADGGNANLLFHQNGGLVCRAFLSDSYARIWNDEVVERLFDLESKGWRVPPARPALADQPGSRIATEADILNQPSLGSLGIKPGDTIAPAGLYASDHDMFAFLVNDEVRIDDGSDGGLGRGVFVTNSEVGSAALKVTRFLYRYVCGNHIVWDAKDVKELRIVHTGRNDHRYGYRMMAELRQYANESTQQDRERIEACKRYTLGDDKNAILDRVFGKLKLLTKQQTEAAYEKAVQQADRTGSGSPRTAWGFAQGITALSQQSPYADERTKLDRAAGKLMSIAF